jgi:hypothetical protein
MNKRTDNDELLEDVLAGDVGAGFRAASLENLLRLARRRRRTRIVQRVGVVAALLLLSAFGTIRYLTTKPAQLQLTQTQTITPGLNWIVSQPLAPTQIVTSFSLTPEQTVTSLERPNLVHTIPGNFREVGDEELLALAAPQIAALVRWGPHEAELVFVAPPAKSQEN